MFLNSLKMKVVNLLGILALVGCTEFKETNPSDFSIPPTDPTPISTKPVEFTVINNSTISNIDLANTSWYALNAQGYENLAYNMQEILRYLKQQNAVVEYYENQSISKTQIE